MADSDDEGELESLSDEENVDQKYWVTMMKKRGPLADFFQIYRKFRLFWGQLNDADFIEVSI